jgi:hypothetical protein
MNLSGVIASLTGRENSSPESMTARTADVSAVTRSSSLRFVPPDVNEHSLGLLREVRERITEVLPGVTFDDEGRGAFKCKSYEVAFDTGSDDQVRWVRVQVTGGRAAAPSLYRLASKTGWMLVAEEQAPKAS